MINAGCREKKKNKYTAVGNALTACCSVENSCVNDKINDFSKRFEEANVESNLHGSINKWSKKVFKEKVMPI